MTPVKFTTQQKLNWEVDKVFAALLDPGMMQRVACPLVLFQAKEPKRFPARWLEGETYKMNMYLFGFLPLGWQQLTITAEKDQTNQVYKLIDAGPGWAVKYWQHQVVVKPTEGNKTFYDETLELQVGLLKPIIYLGMKLLFWWRQQRWQQLTNKNQSGRVA